MNVKVSTTSMVVVVVVETMVVKDRWFMKENQLNKSSGSEFDVK